MPAQTLTIPSAFEQEEIAKFLESLIPFCGEVAAMSLKQHAANARNAAKFLRAPCFTCATGGGQ
jgi:hypothetical protein